MNLKCILWILLLFINHVVGEFLQMSFSSVNMSRVIRSISGITITACHMECGKEPACHDIAISERTPDNHLSTCYLLKKDNGHYDEGKNVLTTIQSIGSGVRVDGQWSCWKSISACTVSCGGGVLNQTRDCDSPRPADGGDNCTGPAERTIKCNEQNCQVNGQWGEWKNISSCNVSCGGGVLNQTRDCDSPRPADGGDNCTGPAERTIKCNEHNCPVNGGFGSWKNLTDCSKSCGGGTLEQTRECDSPKPQHGGSDCAGDNRRTVECNTNGCPVNGGFGSWKNLTDCSKSCGGGTLDQTRECDSPKPQNGGADCAGEKKRTVECNTNGCPVHGGWSKWKNSTDCTKSCGSGTLKQRRGCDSPKPEYGGAECSGIKERTMECNTLLCPVNVALGKNATASSTIYNNPRNVPLKAVDGDMDTFAMTEEENNPWFEVDLGDVKVIKEIRLNAQLSTSYNRGLFVETRAKKGEAWTRCNNVGDILKSAISFKCYDEVTNARFLRINSTEKCFLYFNEVEIFGN